jgi:hypothetical protein
LNPIFDLFLRQETIVVKGRLEIEEIREGEKRFS